MEKDDKRDTYLPNVFPKSSFNEIKHSLMKKAGITESGNFYAYESIIYEKCLSFLKI